MKLIITLFAFAFGAMIVNTLFWHWFCWLWSIQPEIVAVVVGNFMAAMSAVFGLCTVRDSEGKL